MRAGTYLVTVMSLATQDRISLFFLNAHYVPVTVLNALQGFTLLKLSRMLGRGSIMITTLRKRRLWPRKARLFGKDYVATKIITFYCIQED